MIIHLFFAKSNVLHPPRPRPRNREKENGIEDEDEDDMIDELNPYLATRSAQPETHFFLKPETCLPCEACKAKKGHLKPIL